MPFSPEKLDAALRERGLSQKELAEMCGLSSPSISGYVTGAHTPRIGSLTKIAKCLDIKPIDLFSAPYDKTTQVKVPILSAADGRKICELNAKGVSQAEICRRYHIGVKRLKRIINGEGEKALKIHRKRTGHVFFEEEKIDIANEYTGGMAMWQIAEKHFVNRAIIKRTLKEANVKTRRGRFTPLTDEDRREIIERKKRGVPNSTLTELYGISPKRLNLILGGMGK